MARKKSQNSVSLFPFLAVLVCTMGALILLLLLTTRRIQKQQDESVTDATQASDELDELETVDLESPFNLTFADDQKPAAVPNDPARSKPPELPDPFSDSPIAGKPVADSASANPALLPQDSESVAALESSPEIDTLTVPDFNDIADAASAISKESAPTNFELQLEIDELAATLIDEKARHQELLDEIKAAEDRLAASFSEDAEIEVEQLANLKRQEQVLRSQLEDQKQAISYLNEQLEKASQTTEEAEKILQTRESALVSLRQIAKENSELASVGRDRTLLEFSNSTGTSRRPIIVDVSEDGFRFRPSNVAISADQMEGFPKNDNPLLAGIAAAHRHAEPDALRSSAYVLLLVRPNGSLPFYAAQRALKDANIHFGYELVEQTQDIGAGRLDPDEQDAIHTAVASAMTRQQSLYGGLLAQVQELQSSKRGQTDQQPRLLPDGRIALPGESGHDSFGQYFAGGQRPPESVDIQNRLEIARRQVDQRNRLQQFAEAVEATGDRGSQENAQQAPSPFSSELNSSALVDIPGTEANPNTASLDTNPFADITMPAVGTTPNPELAKQTTRPQPANGKERLSKLNSGDEFSGPASAAHENEPSSILESMLVSPDGLPPNGQAGSSQINEVARQVKGLARPGQLAANFGLGNFKSQNQQTSNQRSAGQSPSVGGTPAGESSDTGFWGEQFSQAVSAADANSLTPAEADTETQASLIPQTDLTDPQPGNTLELPVPDRINLSWLQESDASSVPSKPSSSPDSQLTPDWSDSATAPADSTTRTVGAPENPFSVEASGETAQRSETPEGPAAAPDALTESMISKFLRNVDQELRNSRPDPYLLTLLDSANTAKEGRFAGRHHVGIVMDRDQIRVGNSPPIRVQGLTQQQLLDATLNALAAEMDSKPAEAGRFALPYVDWQFDDANRQGQANLQQQLEQMDVPTRATTASGKPTDSRLEIPVLRWPAFDQETPLQNSADPIDVTPPAQSRRGLSL